MMTDEQIRYHARQQMRIRRDKIAVLEADIRRIETSLQEKDHAALAEYIGKIGVVR